MTDVVLRLEEVSKLFGAARAVDRVSLEVQRGHVFTLLGPSGCGKTTTLAHDRRAGTARRRAHRLRRQDHRRRRDHVFVPPHKRNMGMVFQSYAIWPHMTVFDNVAYPLRLRGIAQRPDPANGRASRSIWSAWRHWPTAPRPTSQAASSSASRCAARWSTSRDLLLLDEPFSNLDAQPAPADARRSQAPAAAAGHHRALRHPRSGGSAEHVGRDRRAQPGPRRAGWPAQRPVRSPRVALRARLPGPDHPPARQRLDSAGGPASQATAMAPQRRTRMRLRVRSTRCCSSATATKRTSR